jgi:hypothetical protein
MSTTKLDISRQLHDLRRMTVKELKARYVEVFGEQSRSGNGDFLRKRIAWRLQVLAEGDITERALRRADFKTLYADAGYDAEWVHDEARRDLGVRTVIPPRIGRPTDKVPTGPWRKVMSERIHLTGYGQRWQDETVFSMIKRRQGAAVNATTYWAQCRALMLKAITHNILILYAPTEATMAA